MQFFLFELIAHRTCTLTDFFLSLMVLEINSTKWTNKCWIPKSELSYFNVVFSHNDNLYGLLMAKKNVAILFRNLRGLKWEKILKFCIFGSHI